MSIYKSVKISILLGTAALVACSPDKTENKPAASVSVSEPTAIEATQQPAEGLRVFIDPKTGEYLDSPPEGMSSKSTVSTKTDQPVNEYSDLKESTVPGGGTYIELANPPLKGKTVKQKTK